MENDILINKTFGKLLVIKEGEKSKQRVRRWLCKCSCGNEVLVSKFNLLHEISKSCGCLNREYNLIGKKFERLVVLKKMTERRNRKICWECLCDCGKTVIVKGNNLTTGQTKSCGCLRQDFKKRLFKLDITTSKKIFPTTEEEITELKINRIFNKYKRGAENKNLEFCLSLEIFSSLITKSCHYCGQFPKPPFNGIDRKANEIGYMPENCVPCCTICNSAKKTLSYKDFIKWGLKVSSHINKTFPV